jgi:hypothetical protein
MSPALPGPIPDPSSWESLEPACAEAILPPGVRLTAEDRTGRHCFILLEGTATVEAADSRLCELGAGAFIGQLDHDGHPLPPSGLSIHLAAASRVLVIDPMLLRELVDSDSMAAAAWRQLSQPYPGRSETGADHDHQRRQASRTPGAENGPSNSVATALQSPE